MADLSALTRFTGSCTPSTSSWRFAELTILLIMVLSFLGAGNRTQQRVAKRWVKGKTAPIFWIGMIGIGLVIPLICNISGNPGAGTIASILVLCGGCLLRFLCVWSDDRQPLEGENRYYWRHKHANMDFATFYSKPGKEMERGQTFEYIDNLYKPHASYKVHPREPGSPGPLLRCGVVRRGEQPQSRVLSTQLISYRQRAALVAWQNESAELFSRLTLVSDDSSEAAHATGLGQRAAEAQGAAGSGDDFVVGVEALHLLGVGGSGIR